MRKDGSNQKSKEIQFSLETAEANSAPLVGKFNYWNSDADRVIHSTGDESPEPPVSTQIIGYLPRSRWDEPNPFHF